MGMKRVPDTYLILGTGYISGTSTAVAAKPDSETPREDWVNTRNFAIDCLLQR